jgi:hypothetical protein
MNRTISLKSKLPYILALLLMFAMVFTLARPASAAETAAATPSAILGSTITVTSSGFVPGERVNLWTTDSKGKALDASYILADASGNIEVRIETEDTEGLAAAAEGNYTRFILNEDEDGNITERYLELVLYTPSVGNWGLSASGSSSNISKSMQFEILSGQKASNSVIATPASGEFGSVFTMQASGYLPGERVNLWSTDPNGKAMDASYILADANGNIQVRVETTDPYGLAAAEEGNYSQYVVEYDEDGNVTAEYLRVVLYQPGLGAWAVSGLGSTSGTSSVFNFSIVQ